MYRGGLAQNIAISNGLRTGDGLSTFGTGFVETKGFKGGKASL